MYKSKKPYLYSTDRRKPSVARIRLFPSGTDAVTINGRDVDDYFGLEILRLLVRQPLTTIDTLDEMGIVATVTSGGVTGQAGAIHHGMTRTLLQVSPEFRAVLKAAGFLIRDPHIKERREYGFKAVHRTPRFSKR